MECKPDAEPGRVFVPVNYIKRDVIFEPNHHVVPDTVSECEPDIDSLRVWKRFGDGHAIAYADGVADSYAFRNPYSKCYADAFTHAQPIAYIVFKPNINCNYVTNVVYLSDPNANSDELAKPDAHPYEECFGDAE